YETQEIKSYDMVYFYGAQEVKSKKVMTNTATGTGTENIFDDEAGDYILKAGDHLAYRYEIVEVLGKGSFGLVVRCIDHKLGTNVAVKIIRNRKHFRSQANVEVKILQQIMEWDPADEYHFVRLIDHFYFRGHLCIVTELLGYNLFEYIRFNSFSRMPLTIVRSVAYQTLKSLELLHSKSVIHCDLKPENILLNDTDELIVKTIDFGSSCFVHERVYTYIQSRFYRAPEVILSVPYGTPIDMWSLACILVELHTGTPLFPGENEQQQLNCMMELLGPPSPKLLATCPRRSLFFDNYGRPFRVVASNGKVRNPGSRSFSHALQSNDMAFLDFIAKCFFWNPTSRLTAQQALQHDFITG
ncbi:hypothetical protein CANCADRAFT_20444, partial [Tortispora caseinolytica NRRL Y-17796]